MKETMKQAVSTIRPLVLAMVFCGTTAVLTGCKSGKSVKETGNTSENNELKEKLRAQYGENKQITDGNYDKTLAVKCINGTFVGRKSGDVIAYKGIPFVGKQPVGELRWKAPVDYAPDNGVYEAYYNGKSPCQGVDVFQAASLYVQGEDCLYLNVWKAATEREQNQEFLDSAEREQARPNGKAESKQEKETADDSRPKKPVLVWIHGGAFEVGGTVEPMQEGTNLIQENPEIILVSVEYRLGVFGFLHLSHLPDGKDYPDAQNLGLMDQMMALKWIHENIAGFGGDPDNVTIIGESAGAASVTLLPLIEGSHQYFQKVIAESGSPVFTRSTEEAIACTNELMEALGCKTVADLQKVDVEKLVNTAALLGLRVWAERDGNYLPHDPYEAYANGAAKDLTFLQGCNKDEVNYFVCAFGGADNYNPWGDERKKAKLAQLTDEEKALVENFCKDIKGESYERTSRLFDQIVFIAPLFRLSENQTNAGGKSYTYFFTPESSLPHMKCAHAMELATVFKHPEVVTISGREFDETFSKTMRRMWVQFAKTGNPSLSANQSPDGKAKEWPLYDVKDRQVMVFDEFNIHPEKESNRKILDWERTYFLTKYYCI